MSTHPQSTIGEDEKTECLIPLMNSLGEYFESDLKTICGILHITFEGRPEDSWLPVERAVAFRRFALD
jgi:Domain of unknown function (DUF4419)